MHKGDKVRVYPRGHEDQAAIGQVAMIASRSIAVGFIQPPPFVGALEGGEIHAIFAATLYAARVEVEGLPLGPWANIRSGNIFEIEPIVEPVLCWYCQETVERPDSSLIEAHVECVTRVLVGSVAHQRRTCRCFVPDSTEDDPPGMTLREGARAARGLYLRHVRMSQRYLPGREDGE